MACPDENLIDAFVHGRVESTDRAALAEHLAGCTSCRKLVSALASERPSEEDATATVLSGFESTVGASEKTDATPLFASDELVAERYRIVRFVAEGGMGEVYEAEDLELRRRVALKTVRPQIASEPRALERFRREIALAHKVTHANVCRIFDLGFHVRGERITFLTMEFLDGETLSARLRREGRLSTHDALPIVEQLAEGLAAAHAAGVVHRDFKSPNVMLVRGEHGVRAVISDFGLAGTTTAELDSGSTAPAGLVGSPAYMAPEQVEGRKADSRADIYAFGVVLYEMVAGGWPFVADTPMLMAIKRLQEKPVSPLVRNPALDPRWARVILRCIARDPAARYGSALDVLHALRRAELIARRRWPYAVLAVALAVSGWGAWRAMHAPTAAIVPVRADTNAVAPIVAPPIDPPPTAAPVSATPAHVTRPHAERRHEHKDETPAAPARWTGEIVDAPESQ